MTDTPRKSLLFRLMALPIVLVMFDQALVSGARLMTQVAVAKNTPAGQPGLGFYVSAFGFVVLLLTYLESFVTTPVNVFLPRQSTEQRGSFFAGAIRLTFLVIVLSISICVAAYFLMSLFASRAVNRPIALTLAWYLPCHMLREFSRRWLLATHRIRYLIVLDVVSSVVLAVLLILAINTQVVTAISVFGLVTFGNLLFVGMWWKRYRSEFDFEARSEQRFAKIGWNYGRWVAGEGTFSALVLYFTQWYVSAKFDQSSADMYGACLTLVFLANPFLLGVTSYFSPRGAAIYHESGWAGFKPFLSVYLVLVVAVLGVLAGLIGFCGRPVLELLFGAGDANRAATILSIGMIFQGISFMLAMTLQTVQFPQINTLASFVGALFVVVFSFLFIKSIETAALGFLFSALISVVVRWAGLYWMRQRLG